MYLSLAYDLKSYHFSVVPFFSSLALRSMNCTFLHALKPLNNLGVPYLAHLVSKNITRTLLPVFNLEIHNSYFASCFLTSKYLLCIFFDHIFVFKASKTQEVLPMSYLLHVHLLAYLCFLCIRNTLLLLCLLLVNLSISSL